MNHFASFLFLFSVVLFQTVRGETIVTSQISQKSKAPKTEYTLNPRFKIRSKRKTRRYSWVVHEANAAPDGFWRPVLAINNQMPGPVIEANEGDHLEVTIINKLKTPVTFHWHGLYQNGTNWEDGPSGITQCPIPPGVTYTYKFALDGQYGTFWYHAHHENLKGDGLVGPLIIHSPRDPLKLGIDFDQEIVLVLADWYHTPSTQIIPQMLSNRGYRGNVVAPSANSALINGMGQWDCRYATTGQRCRQTSPPEFNVVAGSRTRFRLVNAGSHVMFFFSADNHTLNVTEADSTPVRGPTGIQRLRFHGGQRYSVIITAAMNEVGSSFYLRAKMDTDCWVWVTTDIQNTAYAIVRVVAPGRLLSQPPSGQKPTTQDWAERTNNQCMDLDPNSLVPIIPVRVPTTVLGSGTIANAFGFQLLSTPTGPPVSFNGSASANSGNTTSRSMKRQLNVEINNTPPPLGNNRTSPGVINNTQLPPTPPRTGARFFVNNISAFSTPQQPILHDFTAGGPGVVNSSNSASVVYPKLGWYDLYLVNMDAGVNHPYHLHGPEMHLVAFGQGLPTPENLRNLTYNTANPLRRDTVLVQGGSFVVVRINTDLPGVWFLHCHMGWHLAEGLSAVVVVQPEKIKSFRIPERTRALCARRTS
ncbi:hypothetical protein CROQUDRAFT_660183 [Cronartium quercuum f. sp. fusiforme G11]|uniref:Laccase n=1 Tax=Cronartium quercuum f. sp. fusiforme G11 TaxID=708437 RepID=A0A9P6NEV1_9BASI|nr:hypothetical protein CROQUDRAFT_660183 [Cronartium quercuum f. sp. fusiforme G11]